jgi:glycosyltransferase involved in cell wall biosynthesis
MRLFQKSLRKIKFRHRKQTPPEKPRVLFVSHEATRTGAPKIILNLLKHFSSTCDVACETILLKGGHIAKDFQKDSIVDCFNLANSQRDELRSRTKGFVGRHGVDSRPVVAICNSMESRFITQDLNEMGIPCVSLVHELPSGYGKQEYGEVFDVSRKVVFPVNFVRDAARAVAPLPMDKTLVLSQGLLNPQFGKGIARQEAYASIRAELGLPDDAFIVLGCGTLDLRKGIDHFANIARRVVDSAGPGRPIHFVWVGEGPRWSHSLYHYVKLDLAKCNADGRVHFIGDRENVEPYFMGADCFLMCSRVDPFPCVIHEAMAASLPVIAFEDAGGAPEALSGGAGFVVPYADFRRVADMIGLMRDHPAVTVGLRERSLRRVQEQYRFVDYAEKMIDVCESVSGISIRKPKEGGQQDFGLRIHRAA